MRKWLIPLAVLALASGSTVFGEMERILDFHSDVQVHEDGRLTVRETIEVRAEGDRIRHGIYREFPTLYRGRWFTRKTVPFDVISVMRDGKEEDYHSKPVSGGVRVYVGHEKRMLKPGTYTYVLEYETADQLGLFADHDELYWNVTGNEWEFPIESASATITLPEGVPADALVLEAYTAAKGAKGADYESHVSAEGAAEFSATRPLAPGEGLTIVVGWPKGYVNEALAAYTAADMLRDNMGLAVGLFGLLILFGYCSGAWVAVGKDPAKGTIWPRFGPPEGFSPAAVRCLTRMGYDERCLTAALVSMAVKGAVRIEQNDEYTLHKLDGAEAVLAPEEKAVARALFRGTDKIVLRQSSHTRIRKAITSLRTKLTNALEKRYFVTNRRYMVPAIVGSLLTLLAAGFLMRTPEAPMFGIVFMCVWLGGWTFGVAALLTAVKAQWKAAFAGGPGRWPLMVGAFFLTLFSIPFLGGEVMGLTFLAMMASPWVVVLLLVLLVVNLVFYHLLKAPTYAGRQVMDEVEGFRMYLSVAERDRLDFMHAPERTPELFEKFLPYAIALDVETRWGEQFADVLVEAGREDDGHTSPWYQGSAYRGVGAAGFAAGLGGSLASAISVSSTAPGSSSGGGGGGSSGGGGGGGGGGGW